MIGLCTECGKDIKMEESVEHCRQYYCFGHNLFITFLSKDISEPLEIEIIWQDWIGNSHELERY